MFEPNAVTETTGDFARSNNAYVRNSFHLNTRFLQAALTILKKICDHPRLVSADMKLLHSVFLTELSCDPQQRISQLLNESNKLKLMLRMLERWQRMNHKALVFSQSN